ncbi:hypothetical protein LZ31DRAFT_235307 [Colletotrichum somersetense]|nr:hypothetical protein LZ31DRAFT_235307 [Colletotrichum somersetense]
MFEVPMWVRESWEKKTTLMTKKQNHENGSYPDAVSSFWYVFLLLIFSWECLKLLIAENSCQVFIQQPSLTLLLLLLTGSFRSLCKSRKMSGLERLKLGNQKDREQKRGAEKDAKYLSRVPEILARLAPPME